MGDDPRRSRTQRALGAGLLASIAVGALLVVHHFWMPRSDGDVPALVERLDLVQAARFAARTPHSGAGAPRHAARRLSLPPGSEIAWSLRMPERAELRIDSLALPADRALELLIEEDAEGTGTRAVRREALAGCAPCRVDLSEHAGHIVRLRLRTGPRDPGGAGPVELVGPVLFGAPPVAAARAAPPAEQPSIVVYLIDTLRPDKLGAYGHTGGLTPALDAFAGEATVFEYAVAQAPWTKPSVASMFTGLYARVHGIVAMNGVLPDAAVTLAETLQAGGYQTAAVVTNGLVDADFGFDQGFARFVREHGSAPDVPGLTGFRPDKPAIDSDVANAAALALLDEIDAQAPFFLYVHVLDPHTPHFPPEPFKSRFAPEIDRFDLGSMESVRGMDELWKQGEQPDARTRAQLESLYDAEIAHIDHQFGRFVEALRSRGLYDDALVVVLSDHGEAFWEHGNRGHGKDLFEELLRVPLVVKAPRQTTPRRVAALAQHVDLMPTLLDFAGLPSPDDLHGESLRPLLEVGPAGSDGAPRIAVSNGAPGTAIREGRWKLLKRSGADLPLELYDLKDDPGETRNVADGHPIVTRYLLETVARLEADSKPPPAPGERALTPAKRDELRALGYVE